MNTIKEMVWPEKAGKTQEIVNKLYNDMIEALKLPSELFTVGKVHYTAEEIKQIYGHL